MLQRLINKHLLRIVTTLRAIGYASQFFSGLHLAGAINFACVLPVIIWGEQDNSSKNVKKSLSDFLKNNTLKIHSYAGILSSLPIIYLGWNNYLLTKNGAYFELALFGFCLLVSFFIFQSSYLSEKYFIRIQEFIISNKHKIGSLILLGANILQYHAGVQLGKSGLTFASIAFLISMALLYFVKPHAVSTPKK